VRHTNIMAPAATAAARHQSRQQAPAAGAAGTQSAQPDQGGGQEPSSPAHTQAVGCWDYLLASSRLHSQQQRAGGCTSPWCPVHHTATVADKCRQPCGGMSVGATAMVAAVASPTAAAAAAAVCWAGNGCSCEPVGVSVAGSCRQPCGGMSVDLSSMSEQQLGPDQSELPSALAQYSLTDCRLQQLLRCA
jgi:hypothetical protein